MTNENNYTYMVLPVMHYILLQFKLTQSKGCTSEGFEVYSNVLTAINGIELTEPASVSNRDYFELTVNGVYDYMKSIPIYSNLLGSFRSCSYVLVVFKNENVHEEIKISYDSGLNEIEKYIPDDDMEDWKRIRFEARLGSTINVPRRPKYSKTRNKVNRGYLAYSSDCVMKHSRRTSGQVFYKRTGICAFKYYRRW